MGNETSTPKTPSNEEISPFAKNRPKPKKKRKSLMSSVVKDEEFLEAITPTNLLTSGVDLTIGFDVEETEKPDIPKTTIVLLGTTESGKSFIFYLHF